MAELKGRRVVLVAAIAGALVGGVAVGGVAAASSGGGSDNSPSSASTGSVTTAAVVRTTLATTVQLGGSIGYDGSYSVNIPSGESAQQVAQAQQQLTQAEESLANDKTINSYGATADDQALTNAQDNVDAADATLSADESKEARACAGRGAFSPGVQPKHPEGEPGPVLGEPGQAVPGLGPTQHRPATTPRLRPRFNPTTTRSCPTSPTWPACSRPRPAPPGPTRTCRRWATSSARTNLSTP